MNVGIVIELPATFDFSVESLDTISEESQRCSAENGLTSVLVTTRTCQVRTY